MGAVGLKVSRWTPDRLKKYQGFEDLSDQEAEKVIDTIDRLAHILLSIHRKNHYNNGQPDDPSKFWKRPKENKKG